MRASLHEGTRSGLGIWAGLFLFLCQGALAEPLHFESTVQRSVMIELYTSEGCSSCPPAEAYLNRYREQDGLWTHFVPLAFHVDYWDYLGWGDRFALPGNAERQRRYARLRHVPTVYTPAFVINGKAWRPGFLGARPAGDGARVGRLAVSVKAQRVEVHFAPVQEAGGALVLHLAVLGMGLESEIRAGENRGRHLRHDFVVLAHSRLATPGPAWATTLPMPKPLPAATRYALVAWVSRQDDPTPLQATGGYLPAAVLRGE